jgi:hypothetical protein
VDEFGMNSTRHFTCPLRQQLPGRNSVSQWINRQLWKRIACNPMGFLFFSILAKPPVSRA